MTRGAHGPRDPWNVIYLCDDHHTLGPDAFHRIGRSTFAARFPQFEEKIRAACERMHKPFYEVGNER